MLLVEAVEGDSEHLLTESVEGECLLAEVMLVESVEGELVLGDVVRQKR